jgi:MFS family permease
MGMLADRAGIKSALGLAAALLAIGALLLSKNAGPLPLLSGSVAYGLSYYAIFGLVPAYIAKILPAERTAPVFGIANVCAGVGGALGNLAGGWSQALTGGLGPVYAGCAVGAALLFVPIMLLPSERRDRAEP